MQFRRRYPGVRATTHYSRILNDDSVDAVVIATPVHTHYTLASQAKRYAARSLNGPPYA